MRETLLVASVLVVGLSAAPLAAASGNPLQTPPSRVTGLTFLPPKGDPQECGCDVAHQGWEFQPQLAVDPSDPDHLAAVWIQDWNDATGVAVSRDGGETWRHTVLRTTPCTWQLHGEDPPPEYEKQTSVNDPSVAIGPDGVVYVASPVLFHGPVVVHRSPDGGDTWLGPTSLDPDGSLARDRTWVATDPDHAGTAWVLWEDLETTEGLRGRWVRRTDDGGTTWSEPSRIPSTEPAVGFLLPLPDGRVADLSEEVANPYGGVLKNQVTGPQPGTPSTSSGPTQVLLRLSPDGLDWSAPPILVAVADPVDVVLVAPALAPDGTLHVFWLDTDPTGFTPYTTHAAPPYTSWSPPIPAGPRVAGRPATGTNDLVAAPNPAALRDGTLALTFYDHRNDPDDEDPLVTDYWLRTSTDGSTWTERHLAGPFDKSAAPDGANPLLEAATDFDDFNGPGNLGEGQGLAAAGPHFVSLFTAAAPLLGSGLKLATAPPGAANPTDLFFTRVKP